MSDQSPTSGRGFSHSCFDLHRIHEGGTLLDSNTISSRILNLSLTMIQQKWKQHMQTLIHKHEQAFGDFFLSNRALSISRKCIFVNGAPLLVVLHQKQTAEFKDCAYWALLKLYVSGTWKRMEVLGLCKYNRIPHSRGMQLSANGKIYVCGYISAVFVPCINKHRLFFLSANSHKYHPPSTLTLSDNAIFLLCTLIKNEQ